MQQIIKSLELSINNSIGQYIKNINSKYPNTDPETLLSLWKQVSDSSKQESKEVLKVASKELKTKQVETKQVETTENGCPYPFSKGSKAGTVCNTKPKNGSIYCSAHKKFEGQEPKPKKVIPEPKKPSSPKDAPVPTPTDTKPIFYTHKNLNILYHRETGMVIKSSKEPIVIGKLNKEIITPLTQDDIDTCKKWRFKYDTTIDLTTFNRSKSSLIKPTQTESKHEIESDEDESPPKQISQPTPKVQPKVIPKQTQPESEDEIESDEDESPKPEPKPTPKVVPKPTTKPEPKPEPKVQHKVIPKQTQPESEDEDESPKPEPKQTPKVVPKPTTKPETKPTPKQPEPESDEEIIDEDNIDEIIEDLSDGDHEIKTKIVNKAFGVKKSNESDSDSD